MEDIPYDKRIIIYLIGIALIILLGVVFVFAQKEAEKELSVGSITNLATIQNNSLLSVVSPYIPQYQILGVEVDELLYEIVRCESGFRSDVCSYAGCGSGQGLAQLIPSTVKYCEKKLGKTIDPFDPAENLECALYLYNNEGVRHWNMSKECWDKQYD